MRFHVFSTAQTLYNRDTVVCAFTRKAIQFYDMMTSLGHQVLLYGREGQTAVPPSDFVSILSRDEAAKWWPGQKEDSIIWSTNWTGTTEMWKLTNAHALEALKRNVKRGDFICTLAGQNHALFVEAFPHNPVVEIGIGYEGIFARFKVFESYAWMHYLYGKFKVVEGNSFDAVIPNYYDATKFGEPQEDKGYLVYVGRHTQSKGIEAAVELARRTGRTIKMIGPCVDDHGTGWLRTAPHGMLGKKGLHRLTVKGPLEYLGEKTAVERDKIVANASAIVCFTRYIGPFEGTHAEAAMLGVPAITSDWGVFTETVKDEVTGFRCRTMGEMVQALDRCKSLDRNVIKKYAVEHWSTDVVRWRYEDYFTRLNLLLEDGFSSMKFDWALRREKGRWGR